MTSESLFRYHHAVPKDYFLCCDYSSSNPSIALATSRDGKVIQESRTSSQALEEFIPSIDRILNKYSIRLNAIDFFVTASGPGSFTGLRCCFATLKALARVGGQPIIAVANDEVRALAWARKNNEKSVSVVTSIGKTKCVVLRYNRGTISRQVVDSLEKIDGPLLFDQAEIFCLKTDEKSRFLFPVSASMLAEFYGQATEKKRASGHLELAALEPDYYGDRWKRSSGP